MKDPIKRAIITAAISVVIIIAAYLIPVVRDSKMGDFLKGASIGAASVAALMVVIAFTQRQKAS